MSVNPSASQMLERLPTGIRGLDRVLGGGFFEAGIYIIEGLPGCGKTILANEIAFRHIAGGARALYITLLAESHVRMFQHLQQFAFFDAGRIPDQLRYLSAYNELEVGGLVGLTTVLRREIRAQQASLLVLDGLTEATRAAQGDREVKKFIQELQSHAVLHGCTMFLLTSGTGHSGHSERTMVDGLIELENGLHQVRTERALRITKFRGSGTLEGRHPFSITTDGIQVFPRLESVFTEPARNHEPVRGWSTGIPSFDATLSSKGLPAESVTVVVGSSGTGKTTLGLHFISAPEPSEPGLFFSFYETPDRLRNNADAIGVPLRELEKQGALTLMWQPQSEHALDELGHRLLDAVERLGARRLVIDGLGGFFEAAIYPERIGRYFAALSNELRRRGVTTLATLETRDAVGSVVTTPYGISALVDSLIFLRFVDCNGQLKRLFSVIKMRNAYYEPTIRALEIDARGARLGAIFQPHGDVIPRATPVDGSGPSG